MTVRRKTDFPLAKLRPSLETKGWDVLLRDTLSAEKTTGEGRFRLVMDKGGRMLLRRMVLAEKPQNRVIRSNGRTYTVQDELLQVSHVASTLDSPDDFDAVLTEMIALLETPGEGSTG